MSIKQIYPEEGLYFAPMEGVTDESYRRVIHQAWPEWDYYCTDFLRIPKHGHYPAHKVLEHFGKKIFHSPIEKIKTGYQILTTDEVESTSVIEALNELGLRHLDVNLGCPSKKVNSHRGGAYLLSDRQALTTVITRLRSQFNGCLSVKMRVGYRNDENFEENLRQLEDLGVEAITIHGRTRDELYKGVARWDYIARAVEICRIPIIGNGDVWTVDDIESLFQTTGCYGIMVGRGALKTPWLATLYRQKVSHNEGQLLELRKAYLEEYFELLEREYQTLPLTSGQILRRFKSFSRYLFDDFPNYEKVRGRFLRSETLEEFKGHLYAL